jgi:hypothetical protein
MSEEKKVIEVCLGVGMNQLFPESIVIEIDPSVVDTTNEEVE